MTVSRPPKYSHHKASGQARVRLNGRDVYLGKYASPESREKYSEIIAAWVEERDEEAAQLSIDQLALAYLGFARRYYAKDGEPTDHLCAVRSALRYLVAANGPDRADTFSARKLKKLRQRMVKNDLSRRYVNDLIAVIKRAFRWAASEELVPSTVYAQLSTVDGLKRGRSDARETKPIEPVPKGHVNAVLPHVSSQIAAMIRLQMLTGMRPQEVLTMRPCDVTDVGDGTWVYRPLRHKSQHHGRDRLVFLGPEGQAVLRSWLERDPQAYCFQPRESDRRHRNKRGPGEVYRGDSYRTAIRRACQKLQIEPWSPNQLRHLYATRIRRLFDLESAACVLGHASADVTQIYAERDFTKAAHVQRQVG